MSEPATTPKSLLTRHGLRAKRHFGQNFLADQQLCQKIAELAAGRGRGSAVEIGAGLGALTRPLLARMEHVIAVERDRDLVPVLESEFSDQVAAGQLEILEADAKLVDYLALLADLPRPHVVAGNLPYQITGPLLTRLVHIARHIDRAVVLVQLEVADRLASGPSRSEYGALSVFVQAQYAVKRAFVVRRGAFYPQPNVDSALVVLDPLPEPVCEETAAFQDVVKRAFAQRRKKLGNAWRGVCGRSDRELAAAAERAGVDLELRGEALDVAAFARVTRELSA